MSGAWRTVLLLGCTSLGAAGQAIACSLNVFGGALSSSSSYFVATAGLDTALVGPGVVEYDRGPASGGPAAEREVFGQVVHIERMGGAASTALQLAGLGSPLDAIVVPWAYTGDCSTIVWERSWRWVEPGSRGFFRATLREPSFWIGGIPTFDALRAFYEPYPMGSFFKYERGFTSEAGRLTVDELFDLFQTLPTREEIEVDPNGSEMRALAWKLRHSALAERFPAPRVLRGISFAAEAARVRDDDSPIAGTYRLSIWIDPAGPPLTLVIRTSARPVSPRFLRDTTLQRERLSEFHPIGYMIHTYPAGREEDLPENRAEAPKRGCGGITTLLVRTPEAEDDGVDRVWRANLDLGVLRRCFSETEGVAAVLDAHRAVLRERAKGVEGLWDFEPEFDGVFRVRPDGSAAFEQETRVGRRLLVRIEGERISREAVSR